MNRVLKTYYRALYLITNTVQLFVGKKKFFMGDEPSEIDCALFGSLAQLKWHGPHPACYVKLLKGTRS